MLAFIDVSGDPYSKPEKSPLIAAHVTCIGERSIYEISAAMHRFKRDILNNEFIEMKSTDIVNKSTLNNPNLQKYKYLQSVVSHCINHSDCKHACVVFNNNGNNKKSDSDRLPRHYVDLLWRVEAIARYGSYNVPEAIVIIDNNYRKVDKYLAFAFNNYIYRSIGGNKLNKIVPAPIFADSETTIGLQIADIAAGIMRQYYINGLHQSSPSANDTEFIRKIREYHDIIQARTIPLIDNGTKTIQKKLDFPNDV